MRIGTYGIAFTSYDVKATKLTKEQMSNEKISLGDNLKKSNELENTSYHTTTNTDSSKLTIFKDPTNDKYVVVSLSKETIQQLKMHFDDDDFMEREDNGVRLTGDVEAFVSGWFADIAYKREFLEADENDDGAISKDEYVNLRNSCSTKVDILIQVDNHGAEKLAYYGEKITQQYTRFTKDEVNNSKDLALSLDDELNMTLKLDKNFDGIMTLEESYLTTQSDVKSSILNNLANAGINVTPLENEDMGLIDLLIIDSFHKFTQLDEKEKIDSLSKILEKTLSNRKEETKEKKEFELEKYIENILKQKKLDEEKNTRINIII